MKWLDDFPSTNGKVVWSMSMSTIVVLTLVFVGIILNRPIQEAVMYGVLGFLGLWAGLDVTQYVKKRQTTIISPPEVMASNATAETAVPVVVPVPTPLPKAGVKPVDPAVTAPLEALAARQQAAIVKPPLVADD